MTESDAKKKLCDHIEYLKHSWKPHPDYDVLDAMELAIKAIEKQKKIKEAFTHYAFNGHEGKVIRDCLNVLSEIKQIIKESDD